MGEGLHRGGFINGRGFIMRKLKKRELDWFYKFNRMIKHETRHQRQSDIMNVGVRIKLNFNEGELFVNERIPRSNVVDRYLRKYKKQHQGGCAYGPGDYITYPEQWFTHKWTDTIEMLVDQEKTPVPESGIPGIVYKKGLWEVNRHRDGITYMLGRFVSIDDAKKVLVKYNKTVAKSGYGVEYE